jgi:subtilisin family serine protease
MSKVYRVWMALSLVLAVVCAASVQTAGAAPAAADRVANEVLIKFKDGTSAVQQQQARGRANARKAETLRAGLERASLPAGANVDAAIAALQADPAVEYAEPNWIYTHGDVSNDPFYTDGTLWGMYGDASTPENQYGSQAAEAWAVGNTGSDAVYVGIIDEGFQPTHPDLDANVWTNPNDPADGIDNDGNGYADDVNGWDFANGDNSIYDGGTRGNLDDHGTHVAGTIGAESNGTGVVGVNWSVTLISGKFLGRNGGTTANAVKAVDYFTDLKTRHGLNIVATNNSWGGGGYSQALYDAIERANNAGILFVAAAGNGDRRGNGINNDISPHYPSSYTNSNIISVAAIDSTGAKTTWSNYGATSVDLGAPGAAIQSTLAYNSYGSYSGTSMATPHVTGAVALYASVKPGATAEQIKTAILSSAIPTASMSGITTTGGRLDANAALSIEPAVP